jgi:hypothetical protein
MKVYYSDELSYGTILIEIKSRELKKLKQYVQLLSNIPLKNISRKINVYLFEILHEYNFLTGDENRMVMQFYKKKKGFNQKPLRIKFQTIKIESMNYQEFSKTFHFTNFNPQTLLFTNPGQYHYARMIAYRGNQKYYRARFLGLDKKINIDGLKTKTVFEGTLIKENKITKMVK